MFSIRVVVGICAAQHIVASALLAIDHNRSTVVERIDGECGVCLATSNVGVSCPQSPPDPLRTVRVDHSLTRLQ